jgi:hypothetical protein
MKKCAIAMCFGVLLAAEGCAALSPAKNQTGEQFCATLPTIGYGHLFHCGTVQSNLQGGLPNGLTGFCMTANTNSLGLVGYSAITSNGGAFPVESFSAAQEDCNLVNSAGVRNCNSIIRCTRE